MFKCVQDMCICWYSWEARDKYQVSLYHYPLFKDVYFKMCFFKFYKCISMFNHAFVFVYGCVHMHAGAHRRQKRMLDAVELESHTV